MATTNSPNMSLPIPTVGVEPGPDYATDVNNSLTIIDAHDHTTGSGVAITPAAMNINANLSMNNKKLTNIAALTLQAQGSTPANGSIYESGVDLYYVDGVGNNIRITQSGSVTGSTGTITGLPSGTASAAFAIDTFIFQQATLTAANIDGASFILRNTTASSPGLTLSPPTLSSNYTITLPQLPGSTSALNITNSGTMGTITYDAIGQAMTSTGANAIANTRTRSSGTVVGVGGVGISANTLAQNISSTTFVAITNSSINITTSGRPVRIFAMPAPGAGAAAEFNLGISTNPAVITVGIVRDLLSNVIAQTSLVADSGGSASFAPSSIDFVDVVAAGTYTYQLVAKVRAGDNWNVINVALCAYEL